MGRFLYNPKNMLVCVEDRGNRVLKLKPFKVMLLSGCLTEVPLLPKTTRSIGHLYR